MSILVTGATGTIGSQVLSYLAGQDAPVHALTRSLLNLGVYGMPIGSKGVSMVDIRDIGEAAAIELLRRHRAPAALPIETYSLVGPDSLTGGQIATIWGAACATGAMISSRWSSA